HDLSPRKALGQNFLLDLNLTRRIARAGGAIDGFHIIEIGPGPGGLTRALLLEGAAHVTVIERDARALPALEQIASAAPGRLSIRIGDALDVDIGKLVRPGMPTRIIANLPYNIATALATNWISVATWPPVWDSMTLMFQKEVGERLVASPGTKAYGRLAVLAGWRCSLAQVLSLPAGVFTPPPKVESALVHFVPRPDAVDISPNIVSAVTAAAFGQRRKMLRSSLKSLWADPVPVLAACGIDPALRADNVPVSGFLDLARRYRARDLSSDGT
ncbi:MAG: 16S rRNA (adenine(1518)-N(6)/adenine(1519)-N(6))-dimethyltransferase RsmA, partial [Alphaproteobacteria bacterium]